MNKAIQAFITTKMAEEGTREVSTLVNILLFNVLGIICYRPKEESDVNGALVLSVMNRLLLNGYEIRDWAKLPYVPDNTLHAIGKYIEDRSSIAILSNSYPVNSLDINDGSVCINHSDCTSDNGTLRYKFGINNRSVGFAPHNGVSEILPYQLMSKSQFPDGILNLIALLVVLFSNDKYISKVVHRASDYHKHVRLAVNMALTIMDSSERKERSALYSYPTPYKVSKLTINNVEDILLLLAYLTDDTMAVKPKQYYERPSKRLKRVLRKRMLQVVTMEDLSVYSNNLRRVFFYLGLSRRQVIKCVEKRTIK